MITVTVLGCGASLGTPAPGGLWGDCDPQEPRNERTRASILIETAATRVLVDTSYDLRLQMNRHQIRDLDAVLLTHAHSDHVSGIDDVRIISFQHSKRLPVYSNQATLDELMNRAPYAFHDSSGGIYKAFLEPHVISDTARFTVGSMTVQAFLQDHTTCTSLGFRVGNFAYSVDVADLSDASLQMLTGLDVWLVDASGYKRPAVSTHATLERVMGWVDRLKPRMTYLTDLTAYMDYQTLCRELPPHVRPAHDGMILEIAA